LNHEAIRELLAAPYYIPTGTPLLQQLQMFQENGSGWAWWSTNTASWSAW